MTLYLTSDEKVLDESNTRTKFKNEILPDFFRNAPFNLKLEEIFFDSKFPTLANFEYPHIITTVIGNEHKLKEFPEKFRKNTLFKYLCKDYKNLEMSPLLIEKEALFESHLSEIDLEVYYELHPRLNFAFSIAFIKDISIHSQKDVIDLLNSFMFPFHRKKPLKYFENGFIAIETNLNLYISKNLFQILGFNNFNSETSVKRFHLPLRNEYIDKGFIEDPYAPVITYEDMLSRMEEESPMYSIYRFLITHEPRGMIQVKFVIGTHLLDFDVEYEMDLFHQRTKGINYDEEIELINRLLLKKYLLVIKEYVLNLKISSEQKDQKDLNEFIEFLLRKDKEGVEGLNNWGGLFTLKRTKHNHVALDVFHTKENQDLYKSFNSNINNLSGAPLVKQAALEIFYSSKLKNVSFNPPLCHLLGLSESAFFPINLQMEGEKERIFPFPLNYYKTIRHEIANFVPENKSIAFQLIKIEEEFATTSSSIKLIKTNQDDMFMVSRKGGTLLADESINLKTNSPQLIFVMANFVQHSLVGSNQKKMLNFFPLPAKSNNIVHHKFKRPIILKMIPGSVFHINLVDENFNPVKADIGVPTLLALKKTVEENMFPITLISSDENNLRLFPENKSNSFKNKLSFPLILNNEHRWGVSLRSIAYPKVMNIFSRYCFFTAKKTGQEQSFLVSLDNSYVISGTKLIYLLNQKIRETLSIFSDAVLPTFSLKDGFASIETKDFECHLNGALLRILGLTLSYQENGLVYYPQSSVLGVLEMNLFLLQPQEMMIISNIVEEAFYAQHRPKILKIVPILTKQSDSNAYNYIQFEDDDTIPVKLDRIDEIEISIMNRKGDLIDFVDLHDVKCQLEFKRMP